MKILIISHEYPPIGGGGANACMYLSREYAKAGHEIHIITVWYDGQPEKQEISEYGDPIHIDRLRAKRRNKEHCGFGEMFDFLDKASKYADRCVKEAIISGKPYDICQIFFGIPSGPIGYRLKRKYGLPYVIRFGGGDIPGFQDRFRFAYKLIGPALRLIWKHADALVANSEGLKSFAEGFCNEYPIQVIPNGVDTDSFQPLADRTYDRDKIELLFVSRLLERKGLQYVIPGLKELEKRCGRRLHLTIVGDGPYKEILENLAKQNGVSDMISFEGQKDKDEILTYYQSADIFIFPSKKEGMPNAVLEAMACALPIVMSPCQGSKELIDGNGVVSDTDLTMFNESLLKLLTESSDVQKNMSRCSRKKAVDFFSWQSTANSYLDIMG